MKRALSLLLVLAVGASVGSTLGGCSGCDTGGQSPVRYEDGEVSADGRLYETTPIDAELLHFPPGRIYDLVHGLGETPVSVQGYVSLSRRLTPDGDPYDPEHPNNVTETAGNQLVIERWDDEIIRVRNDTCAEWYVRVVAIGSGDVAPVNTGGAGGAS